jgi:hypothetical protein
MLDEEEFRQVFSVLRTKLDWPIAAPRIAAEYERITGVCEAVPVAIFHHRISIYGHYCQYCGKPLRTPQARLCGACMKPVRKHWFEWLLPSS